MADRRAPLSSWMWRHAWAIAKTSAVKVILLELGRARDTTPALACIPLGLDLRHSESIALPILTVFMLSTVGATMSG